MSDTVSRELSRHTRRIRSSDLRYGRVHASARVCRGSRRDRTRRLRRLHHLAIDRADARRADHTTRDVDTTRSDHDTHDFHVNR